MTSTKLFVGQVPKHIWEDDLRKIFEPCGTITDITVLREHATGEHRGCGFVSFADQESCENAINWHHNKTALPNAKNPLQVSYSNSNRQQAAAPGTPTQANVDMDKLFVGMIPKTATEDEVRSLFVPFGTIESFNLLRQPDGSSKGCAFVKFSSREQAANAIASMNTFQMPGSTTPLVVKFADPPKKHAMPPQMNVAAAAQAALHQQMLQHQLMMANPAYAAYMQSWPQAYQYPGQGAQSANTQSTSYDNNNHYGSSATATDPNAAAAAAMYSAYGYPQATSSPTSLGQQQPFGAPQNLQREGPPGSNLFIYHLPIVYSDNELTGLFSPYGTVLSAKVFVDKATNQGKGFGFVSYDNANSAAAAIANMDGYQLGNKRLRVTLKKAKNAPY